MIHPYNDNYLEEAMDNLGEMLDYAVNACCFEIEDFWGMFLVSGIAHCFENGNPKIISGRSGTELVQEVVMRCGIQREFPEAQIEYDYNPEYWTGWILAYYQWATGQSFEEIEQKIKLKEICEMYSPWHEASEQRILEAINERICLKAYTSRLQQIRKESGYSQKQLAEKSGVNIRMIQQYETNAKDIQKAAATTVLSLANVLGCKMEDLIR